MTPAAQGHPPDRPIGWWLKHADARLEAAFARALDGTGVDRRRWQVLTTVAGGRAGGPGGGPGGTEPGRPVTEADLVAALADFDTPDTVRAVVADLRDRGLLTDADGVVVATDEGRQVQASLAPRIGEVRRAVAVALPGDDYPTLVALLRRLADAV
jgi:hypothetical protein